MAQGWDWDEYDEAKGGMVPPGRYLCEVADVNEKTTRNGDLFWLVHWRIIDGEYLDQEFRDAVYFHTKGARPRAKSFLLALALDLNGVRGMPHPDEVVGRRAMCDVFVEEYESRGKTRKKNSIPYAGFGPVQGQEVKEVGEQPPPHEDDDFGGLPPPSDRPSNNPFAEQGDRSGEPDAGITDDDIPF